MPFFVYNGTNPTKHRRCIILNKNLKKILYWVLIALFSIIFIVSAVFVVKYIIDSRQSQEAISGVQDMYSKPTWSSLHTRPATNPGTTGTIPPLTSLPVPGTLPPTQPPTDPTDSTGSNGMLPDLEAMYNLNNDVVGYIYVEDTNINYPVLHHPSEKDYYLYRDLYGNEDRHGSVYVREACDVFKPSDNVTIYGHNMADGTMFAHLHRYKREDFFNSHSIIYFDTLYERHAYQVVCVFRTSGTYGVGFPFHLYDNFKDEAEFKEFISTARDLAIFDSGISVEYGDKFICLSTCEDWPIKNGRLVVLAVRIA